MSQPVIYTIVIDDPVKPFYNALDAHNRGVVDHYFDLIARGLVMPDKVRSEPHLTYKVNIPSGELQGWPNGLRIFFRVKGKKLEVWVIDMGDHHNSARNPGKSVYSDER